MRNSTLDALRAAAILLVFGRHTEFPVISGIGWVGVDLFFALSGFLVSGLLFREHQKSGTLRPGLFLLRRGFKIYPQFYFFILTTAGLGLALFPIKPFSLAAELMFFQNYAHGLWLNTWSLGVEEHFYLLLAAALVLLARRGGADPFRALPKWIAGVFFAVFTARFATWALSPNSPSELDTIYKYVFPSHLRIDSLAGGVAVSYFHFYHRAELAAFARRFGAWLPPASVLLLAPVAFFPVTDPFIYTIGFSMIAAAFSLLLIGVLYPAQPHPLGIAGRAMAWLGTLSYGFYLWHGAVLLLCSRFELSPWTTIPAGFAATLLIAWVTTRLIEEPLLRLRDRRFPSDGRRASLMPRPADDAGIAPAA